MESKPSLVLTIVMTLNTGRPSSMAISIHPFPAEYLSMTHFSVTSDVFFLTTFFLRWTGSSIHLLDLQLGQRDGPPSLRESHSYPHTWHLHSRVALFHAYEPQLGHLRA